MAGPGRTVGTERAEPADSASGASPPSPVPFGADDDGPASRPVRGLATVVRPPAGVSRRHDRGRRRRRRRLVVGSGLVVVLLGATMAVRLVGDGWGPLGSSGSGAPASGDAQTLLLAWSSGDGDAATLVLIGAPPQSTRGAAMLMPGRTQVEVPSFGSRTLGDTLATIGAGSAALAVENALGYPIGDVLAFDPSSLAALFEATAPLRVRLRSPAALGERRLGAGERVLSGADAARLVSESAEGSSELDHLVVVHAVLEGWLAGLDGDGLGLTEQALADALAVGPARARRAVEVLDETARRRVTFDTLDVASMSLPGQERYTINEDETLEEMASLFPGLDFAAGEERVRVEVLNGTGRAGLAGDVARRLLPVGGKVVLSGNAARFGLEKTLIVLQDARFEARAERMAKALGVGRLRMARDPVGVADVSIVIGADFEPGT